MSIHRLLVLSVVVALACSAAGAQEDIVGRRVRIGLKLRADPSSALRDPATCGRCDRIEGTLVEVASDGALVVRPDQPAMPVSVPAAIVAMVEVSEGLEPAGRAAARGALFGAAFGALSGAAYGGNSKADVLTEGQRTSIGAIFLGAAGAGVGALIGASLPGERWRVVRGGRTKVVRFGIAPVGGRGAAASITVAF